MSRESVSNKADDSGVWWEHVTPAGNLMWTGRKVVPMSELEEIDNMPEPQPWDDCDDPDADGYGWERKALNSIGGY